MDKLEDSPEVRAWLSLAGLVPVLTADEYLALTAHYSDGVFNQAGRKGYAARQALKRARSEPAGVPVAPPQAPSRLDAGDRENPLAAVQYALAALFAPGDASSKKTDGLADGKKPRARRR